MGSEKIELPDGHYAILKDPMTITERQARGIQRRYVEMGRQLRAKPDDEESQDDDDGLSDEKLDLIEEFEHFMIAYFVQEWDYEFKPTGEKLYDLPAPVYNELDDATDPLIAVLMPAVRKRNRDAKKNLTP